MGTWTLRESSGAEGRSARGSRGGEGSLWSLEVRARLRLVSRRDLSEEQSTSRDGVSLEQQDSRRMRQQMNVLPGVSSSVSQKMNSYFQGQGS